MIDQRFLFGLVALFGVAPVVQAQSGGQQVCFGDYILCDAARCDSNRSYSDGEPIDCDCIKPPPGLNIGNSPCALRKQLSTYSLWNINPSAGKPSKAWSCSAKELLDNGRGWAFCLDAPCVQDEDGDGWTCSCTYVDPSNNPATMYTFGLVGEQRPEGCERDCKTNWSGATWSELLSGYGALAIMHTERIDLGICRAEGP